MAKRCTLYSVSGRGVPLQLMPQKAARRPTRQEPADTASETGRVGAGASLALSAGAPSAVASMSVGQAEEGVHEAPVEDTVRPGTVAMLQVETAVSMAYVSRSGVTAMSQEETV
jgi:hypothetical protein